MAVFDLAGARPKEILSRAIAYVTKHPGGINDPQSQRMGSALAAEATVCGQ